MVFKASCVQGPCITPINSVEGVLKYVAFAVNFHFELWQVFFNNLSYE